MSKEVVIIGAGGHGKVIADMIEKSGDKVYGFLDDTKQVGEKIMNEYEVLGKISECEDLQIKNPELNFIIAIGNNFIREEIDQKYALHYYIAIHPNSNIGMDVKIGEGTVVMPNTCINASTKIGRNCIINTGAIIEHDNIIEDFVHVSPNATLCGTVHVGKYTHIGAGAIVKNNIKIIDQCILGAGAVVVGDISKQGTYIGVPAKLK